MTPTIRGSCWLVAAIATALSACTPTADTIPPAAQVAHDALAAAPRVDPGEHEAGGYPVAAPAVIAQALLTRINPQASPLFQAQPVAAALDDSTPAIWALPVPADELAQSRQLWHALVAQFRTNPAGLDIDKLSPQEQRQIAYLLRAPDLDAAVGRDAAWERAAMWCGVATAPVVTPRDFTPNLAYVQAIEAPVRACARLTLALSQRIGAGPFADPAALRSAIVAALEEIDSGQLEDIWRSANTPPALTRAPGLGPDGLTWLSQTGEWYGGAKGWTWRGPSGRIEYGEVFLAGGTPELRLLAMNPRGGRNTASQPPVSTATPALQ